MVRIYHCVTRDPSAGEREKAAIMMTITSRTCDGGATTVGTCSRPKSTAWRIGSSRYLGIPRRFDCPTAIRNSSSSGAIERRLHGWCGGQGRDATNGSETATRHTRRPLLLSATSFPHRGSPHLSPPALFLIWNSSLTSATRSSARSRLWSLKSGLPEWRSYNWSPPLVQRQRRSLPASRRRSGARALRSASLGQRRSLPTSRRRSGARALRSASLGWRPLSPSARHAEALRRGINTRNPLAFCVGRPRGSTSSLLALYMHTLLVIAATWPWLAHRLAARGGGQGRALHKQEPYCIERRRREARRTTHDKGSKSAMHKAAFDQKCTSVDPRLRP